MSVPAARHLGNGIHQIPAPLPYKAPPWVNTYVIEAGDGLILIDCGTDWEPGRQALARGFSDLGLDEAQVHTLIVSHLHPDHVGMSARVVREFGCRFVMHERAAGLVDKYNDTPGQARRLESLADLHGMPADVLSAGRPDERPDFMPFIEQPDHLLSDGDSIDLGEGRSLVVVHTPGHEQAHICLRDSRTGILFSGDHILPRISPVVMYNQDTADPLGDYMASLERLIGMGIGLTYPAHGTLIDRGDERAHQILLHHRRRLSDMADLVARADIDAWNVVTRSFRPNLDPTDSRLAFLETVSHLEHLRLSGRIGQVDSGGRILYQA
ncbi:MAG TPA: MBL fold metallo-hydrolase [Acidimicrobiia bacterium]|nr:MBL fold metallo-hydrolase [Acidimicrobiia bacterium]